MIRINLLGVERQRVRKTTPLLDPAQRALFGCSLVLGLTVLALCGWYWHLSREAARLDGDWRRALREWDGDPDFYTTRVRPVDERLPWDHFDVGVKKPALLREWERARAEGPVAAA